MSLVDELHRLTASITISKSGTPKPLLKKGQLPKSKV